MGSRLGKKFETKSIRRFLMHYSPLPDFTCELIQRLHRRINGTLGQTATADGDNKQFQKEIHLLTSYLKHSCLPTVIKLVKDNVAVCRAILPIKEGGQLFRSRCYSNEFGRIVGK